MRRFVLAPDVRGFRLYFAMKAGLVDGLVEPAMPRHTLARHLLGAVPGGASGLGPRGSRSQRASVSVSVFEFVFEGGSRLAVFRLAWVESVGNHGVESGRPAA